jgi:2-C-methyl-D-erythritol 4-phosphate cytidylyltransferase
MKKYAIIVAGGTGKRMGSELPKQFILLKDKPVLYYTLKTFLESFDDLEVILVLHPDYSNLGQEIIDAWFDPERIVMVNGGSTRFQSVRNGLAMIKEEGIIFVHDAVRCLVTEELIKRCYDTAMETGIAVPAIPARDSTRIVSEDGNEVVDRDKLVLVQTPQTFHSKILLPAFQIDFKDQFTDEATVVEAFGLKIILVEGEESNIKITRPFDLMVAEKLLENRE